MRTVFVSSTFRDMQEERDAIRDQVAPLINSEARRHGDEVDFCDLRWGVNTEGMAEEEGSRKVLDVCLSEIDRSQPPMVILLGDRYGWIPDSSLIAQTAAVRHFTPGDLRKSVTALEIEYGAFFLKRPAYVYIRRIRSGVPPAYGPESTEHARLLNILKHQLAGTRTVVLREYDVHLSGGKIAPEELSRFSRMVAEDLTACLRPRWEEYDRQSEFDKEQRTQWAFLEAKNAQFLAREADLTRCLRSIDSGKQVTVATGPAGSGKTTLFARLAFTLRERGWDVLPFVGGLTQKSNDAMDVLRYSAAYLEKCTGAPEETGGCRELQQRMQQLSADYQKTGRQMLIMVDAVDQLADDSFRRESVFTPGGLPPCIHFFLTGLPDTPFREKAHIPLVPLTAADRRSVVKGVLQYLGRELSGKVTEAVCELPAAKDPLYVSLLVERLRMMDAADHTAISHSAGSQMDAITRYQLEMIRSCPEKMDALCVALFREAGKRVNPALLDPVMEALAASRYGLRPEDLSALTGTRWSRLDFSRFVSLLNENFQIRGDGRYDFMHKSIRSGFQAEKDLRPIHAAIADVLGSCPNSDPVKQREYIYHLFSAGQEEKVLPYIRLLMKDKQENIREIRKNNARCLYFCIRQDGGKWLAAQCARLRGNMLESWFLCSFTALSLLDCFGETPEEFRLLQTVSEAVLTLYRSIQEKLDPVSWFQVERTLCSRRIYAYAGGTGGEDKRRMLAEEFFSMEKNHTGTPQNNREAIHLLDAYYLFISTHKYAGSSRETLQQAADVFEELQLRLRGDLAPFAQLLTQSSCKQIYGCMGEVWHNLGAQDRSLAAYREDMGLRGAAYLESPTRENAISYLGGIGNVMTALIDRNTEASLQEALTLGDQGLTVARHCQELPGSILTLRDYTARIHFAIANALSARCELRGQKPDSLCIPHLLEALQLSYDNAEESAEVTYINIFGFICTTLSDLQIVHLPERKRAYADTLAALIARAEEAQKKDTSMEANARMLLLCRAYGRLFLNCDCPPVAEKAQHYFEMTKDITVTGSSGPARKPSAPKPPAAPARPVPRSAEPILRRHAGNGKLRLLRPEDSRQINNAVKAYASVLRPENAIAILDTSFLKNGKTGLLFTAYRFASSEFPGALRYSDLQKLTLTGDCLTIRMEDGTCFTLDIGIEGVTVYRLLSDIQKAEKG